MMVNYSNAPSLELLCEIDSIERNTCCSSNNMNFSLNEYDNPCLLAKELCKNSIVSFDDSEDFTEWTTEDYLKKIKSWMNWQGPCKGTVTELIVVSR